MKAIILTAIFLLTLSHSFAQKGSYTATLVKVEAGNSVVPGSKIDELSYQDSLIKMVWTLGTQDYNFVLHNMSDNTIKIIWDDAAYIGPEGNTGKIMHTGIKFTDRANPQVPTSIIKGAKLSDLIAPVDKVYFSDLQYSYGWRQKLLYGYSKKQGPINDGASTRILVPLSVDGKTIEYLFEFKIKWIAKVK